MKKQFYFLLFSLTISIFGAAQIGDGTVQVVVAQPTTEDDKLPEKDAPFKFGKYLLFFSSEENKTNNSTELKFELYDQGLKKANSFKVVVEKFTGKFCSINYIFDQVPGNEWMEISLREKLIVTTSLMIRVNSAFKIVGRYNVDPKASNAFDKDNIATSPINYIPLDHFAGNLLSFGFSELDARTADGSMIYLNYDMSNNRCPVAFFSAAADHGDLNAKVKPTTLCYLQSGENDFKLTWKVNIKDEHILAYKIYLFGDELFLYTSRFVGGPKEFTTEQMIRKIDVSSGKVLYEVKLETKPNFELMLSNATYDNVSKDFIFCGNYITSLSAKEQKKSAVNLSMFFISKIDANGKYTTKDVELTSEKPDIANSYSLNVPFLAVKQLARNSNGEYVAAGQYNYMSPTPINDGTTSYAFLPGGLGFVVFDGSLNVSTQEIDMITFANNNPTYATYFCYVPETAMLGSKNTDMMSFVNSGYNAETGTIVISQDYYVPKLDDHDTRTYVLKIKDGKRDYFQVALELPHTEKTPSGYFILDAKSLVYFVTSQLHKNEYSKIDL